jgi:vacuolar-type H+-ATPase subunit C/Vma6
VKGMLACEHYRRGAQTEIVPSEGYPWNGFYIDENGFRSFEAGLFWRYLEHLLQSRKCRREAKTTKRVVQRLLRRIEREWRAATS